jgi:hypothetical protein
MGPITKFLTEAWTDGFFAQDFETPEALRDALEVREGSNEDIMRFIKCAVKTSFANLTAYEMLCGKIKAAWLAERGEDWLQDRTIAEPLDKRVACVIREAKWWDYQVEQASYKKAGAALAGGVAVVR